MTSLLAVRHTTWIEMALGPHTITAAVGSLVHMKAMDLTGAQAADAATYPNRVTLLDEANRT